MVILKSGKMTGKSILSDDPSSSKEKPNSDFDSVDVEMAELNKTFSEYKCKAKNADKGYLSLLLDSYRQTIEILRGELTIKDDIIRDLLQSFNKTSSKAMQEETNKPQKINTEENPMASIKVKSFLDNNWVKDDISMKSDSTNHDGMEWIQVERKGRQSCNSMQYGKPFIQENRFCGLICHEPTESEAETLPNRPENCVSSIKDSTTPRRPNVVPPKFPERGHNFARKVQPGNSTYANRLKFGKNVLLAGDSMVGRIKVREFNNCVKEVGLQATMRKKFFPGGKAKELAHYLQPTFEAMKPDVFILHVGTNDLQD